MVWWLRLWVLFCGTAWCDEHRKVEEVWWVVHKHTYEEVWSASVAY